MSTLRLEDFEKMLADVPRLPDPKYYVIRVDGINNPVRQINNVTGDALFGLLPPIAPLRFDMEIHKPNPGEGANAA